MAHIVLGVLASGGGTNLQAIIDRIEAGHLTARIAVVISNNSQAGALERAKRHGLPTVHLSRPMFLSDEEHDLALLRTLQERGVELVILAGYMKKLGRQTIAAYRNRILNIHPALLPGFGGPGMYGRSVHEAVLASGATVSGVTVHLVDEEYDHGPIVVQRTVPVYPGDTPETLAERVLAQEHALYAEVIQLFAEGRVTVERGKVTIDRG
jgi:phosphoribosylglycinamide formyltransferase-1